MRSEKNSNNAILLIIIVIVVAILLSIYYMYFRNRDAYANNYSDWLNVEKSTRYIKIVESNGYYYFNDKNNETKSSNVKATYYCIYDDCNGIYVTDNAPFSIIKDGKKYVIYNYDLNNYRNLNINETINLFDILCYDNNAYGIVVGNKDLKYKVYSLLSNKFLSEYKYTDYENNSASLLNNNILLVKNNDETAVYEILNLKTGFVNHFDNSVYSEEYKGFSKGNKNSIFYLIPEKYNDNYRFKLINNDFKLIATTSYDSLEIDSKNNAVIIKDKNRYEIYDKNGNVIKTSKQYSNIISLIKGYIFVADIDNNIKLIDYNENVVSVLGVNDENYVFHTDLAGWYTKDNKDAIYLPVEDTSIDGDEKGFEFYYIPLTGEKGKNTNSLINGYEKPIIYLYPEKDNTIVNIKFEHKDLITTSYPKYNNEWNVIANINGDLKDLNNKYYYALYFEEKRSKDILFNEGFYVTKDNAIEFLEDKLSIIGLNDREKNEFIMYWLPVLEKNEKSLVYFELTESREKYNQLMVTPKVDSMLRIAIHIKKVNEKTNIKEQILPTFKRKGFTLIEWGGVNHK